jgi:hypothetical protein
MSKTSHNLAESRPSRTWVHHSQWEAPMVGLVWVSTARARTCRFCHGQLPKAH